MGFSCARDGDFSFLLCEEDDVVGDIFGCNGEEEELPVLGMDMAFAALPSQSDEVVASLMEKEKEQLHSVATGDYLQRLLSAGGLESSCRIAAIDWIKKATDYHYFGPLSAYLAVNYLDRYLSTNQIPADQPWMPQLLSIACLTIAAKMEETVVPRRLDFHDQNQKYTFELVTIQRMEIHVLGSLNWRMQAVTPFSYINYFVDKFTEGKPLSCGFISRCTEIILGTLEATKFLQFRPSEIAAAVVLSAAAESYVIVFSSALLAANIPVSKENVKRCHEALQEVGLVKKTDYSVMSPSRVLDASCFSFKTDDKPIAGSSQGNNNNNNYNQAYAPPNKRTRLDI
ncbi:cyclin-D2-2 [Sorghum bicolor]|uniref:cyclin-D2-2 n=1 Tax=Sorghum bicolor TaxID=4558 RepID=UPI000B42663E|nr:cyclin-D2-2 [Sorghum bicolor]|eukprot:XP_021308372.1 cyclin-D2-2 [Sorghum bicolor]